MASSGILYIVATPIGNLQDITFRAVRILREVELIAAEDTRQTRKLLHAFDVQTPLVSLHEHNEGQRSVSLISKMQEGLSVAYVSDAGTPGLSDPGFRLIRAALARGISVVPVPGASAVMAALSASGLPMNRFLFQGFLSAKTVRRRQQLSELQQERGTLVFFESPNRLLPALHDIFQILGNRDVVVCRELTKIYESFLRAPVQDMIRDLEGKKLKGEITLLVSGCLETRLRWSDASLLQRFEQLRRDPSLTRRDCVERIAAETGESKSRVYRLTVKA